MTRTAPPRRPTWNRPARPSWPEPANRCCSATARCWKATGPANVDALRREIPELFRIAAEVRQRQPVGVAACKPPNSHPEDEARVFDFVGMMGLPLVPCYRLPTDAAAGFYSIHALKDPALAGHLTTQTGKGVPLLITDGLAKRLAGQVQLDSPNIQILPIKDDPKSLLELPQSTLDTLRQPLLQPFGHTFKSPNRVALYLFADGSWVVENFNDRPVQVELNSHAIDVPARLAIRMEVVTPSFPAEEPMMLKTNYWVWLAMVAAQVIPTCCAAADDSIVR